MKVCNVCGERFDYLGWNCPNCNHNPQTIDDFIAFAPELAKSDEGFNIEAFPRLAKLEAKNFWFCSRNRLIIWALRRYFSQMRSFMEIGCGTGYVLSGIGQAFPKLDLYGSEIFTTGLGFAAKRLSKAKLFQMDARTIPFEKEFDVIGAFDVLEHIKEDQTVLAQIYRATTNGGGIILTVPQHPWLWSQTDELAHHVRRYRAKELKTKVESAGFKVVKVTSFVSLLLPLMIISRFKRRKQNRDSEAGVELEISGWLNTTLETILNLELTIIKLGISFPAGGSLLLVARKL